MSKKTAVIIVSIAFLLIIAAVVFFYFFYGRGKKGEPEVPGEFPATEDAGFPREEEKPTVLPEDAVKGGPVLRQLTTTPVSGAVIGGSGARIAVRYLDRATGNIFEISPDGGAAKRITNTTIPKIYEALFAKSGAALLARYLKEDGETIETFSGTARAKSGSAEGELVGTFLPPGIKELALSPDGKRVFYLREESGGAVGIAATIQGGEKTEIFRSPLREWLAAWPKTDTIMLTAKPSALAEGIVQFLNPETGQVTPAFSRLRGLTALSDSSATQLLYSASAETDFSLALFERKNRKYITLPFRTIPEKCVFAAKGETLYCAVPQTLPPASYPDAWYQGALSFEDQVWTLDTASGIPRLIMDVSAEARAPIDAVSPALSADEEYLIFVNKADGTLWSLRLAQ